MDCFQANSEQPPFSLVRYEPPIDITQKLEAYQKAKNVERITQYKPSVEDILNMLLPPRQWKTPQNNYFIQYVSHQRPEREDVQRLENELEHTLMKWQAKTKGICPIRQYLFNQSINQIIRQVTINSPERGLVLLRLRDQRKMTVAAYQTMHQQSISFAMKKQLQSEEGMEEMQAQLNLYENKKAQLQKKKEDLLSKKQSLERKIRERKAVEVEKKQYQINAIRQQFSFLQKFILQMKNTAQSQIPEQNQQD